MRYSDDMSREAFPENVLPFPCAKEKYLKESLQMDKIIQGYIMRTCLILEVYVTTVKSERFVVNQWENERCRITRAIKMWNASPNSLKFILDAKSHI